MISPVWRTTLETESQKPSYKFGVFELDLRAGELRKYGVRLRLQQQPLQVLAVLLEREGEVVTRENIQKRLWANDTYVDFDNAINSAIRKLREALADSPDCPRFIETLPRRGYRFIAPVSQVPASSSAATQSANGSGAPASATESSAKLPSTRRRGWVAQLLLFSLILLVLGFRIWFADPMPKPNNGSSLLKAVPFTSYPGFQVLPSFSPEGTRVAFTWQHPGVKNPDVYIKLLGTGEAVRLSRAGGFGSTWSPDGQSIAFLRPLEDFWHVAIIVVPSVGGQEREVARITFDAARIVERYGWPVPGPFLVWSLDGKWLLTLEQDSPGRSKPHAIIRVSVESGEKRILTWPLSTSLGDGALNLAPDGKSLAYTQDCGFWARDIYVVPVSSELLFTGKPKQLTFDNKAIAGLAWTSDGKYLVFSSPRNGQPELWKIATAQGSRPIRLGSTDDEVTDIAISRSGNHLVFAHQIDDQNIWRAPLNDQHGIGPTTFIASTRRDTQARYSPNGERIAFESNRSGNEEVWICNADSSNLVQLTHFGNAWAGAPKWSPNGKEIAFAANAAGNWDIYIVSSGGGKPRQLTSDGADQSWPSWSRDGKWIYYYSNRGKQVAIRKMPVAGGTEVQVTNNGGAWSEESFDGKALFYFNEQSLWTMPVAGGTPVAIEQSYAAVATKDGLYYSPAQNPSTLSSASTFILKLFDPKTKRTKTVGTLPGPLGWNLDVSPDEHWIIYSKTDREGSELMLVESVQ